MIIKSLKLKNIRSYTDQIIDFPDKSIMLSGDIGSGKSTLLLAIEFALFEINKRNVLSEKPRTFISSAKSVFDLMNEKLKDEKQEHFIILMLNSKNYIYYLRFYI